jgi:hypothetical protein
VTVPFEDSFENHFPKERRSLVSTNSDGGREPFVLTDTYSFDFDGVGFAILGNAASANQDNYVFNADLYVDGELVETASWPTQFTKRRFYLFWKYALANGPHSVEVRLRNPSEAGRVMLEAVTIYGDELLATD